MGTRAVQAQDSGATVAIPGRVVDHGTGRPIVGAEVQVVTAVESMIFRPEVEQAVRSDDSGRFVLAFERERIPIRA